MAVFIIIIAIGATYVRGQVFRKTVKSINFNY